MSFVQAIVLGLLQGVTELFPVSSLGHSVILPAFLGWNDVVAAQQATESYFLAFLVGLHVATALALAWFFRAEWRRIIWGLLDSVRRRSIDTPDARLGWLLKSPDIDIAVMTLSESGLDTQRPPTQAAGLLTCTATFPWFATSPTSTAMESWVGEIRVTVRG